MSDFEQEWRDRIGKLLHFKVDSVHSFSDEMAEVQCTIIEDGTHFAFDIYAKELNGR